MPYSTVHNLTQFKYFNFKLAVIGVLMYEEEVIRPQFSVHEFLDSYTRRRIDIKKEGYAIIPKVRQYFEDLEIPAQLLSQVEEIS